MIIHDIKPVPYPMGHAPRLFSGAWKLNNTLSSTVRYVCRIDVALGPLTRGLNARSGERSIRLGILKAGIAQS
jgi:hypothetical protein